VRARGQSAGKPMELVEETKPRKEYLWSPSLVKKTGRKVREKRRDAETCAMSCIEIIDIVNRL